MSGQKKVVAITGAAGYVGSWLCKYFSEAGYGVRALVRDRASPKNAHLAEMKGVSFMEADMLKEGAYDEAFDGADGVVHAAAVVDIIDNTEEAIVTPTVEGTKNVLASARKSSTIKHLIGTSSIAAVTNFAMADEYIMTERDTVDLDHPDNKLLYAKAKVLEERLLWEYQQSTDVPVTTINPGMVWGPCLAKRHTKASPLYVRQSLYGNTVPPMITRTVDVRDVAKAHVNAFENPSAYGQRFLLINDDGLFKMSHLEREIKAVLPKYKVASPPSISDLGLSALSIGHKIPGLSEVLASKTGIDQAMLANMTRRPTFDNSKSKDVLGLKYRPLSSTIKDTVESMVSNGYVAAKMANA